MAFCRTLQFSLCVTLFSPLLCPANSSQLCSPSFPILSIYLKENPQLSWDPLPVPGPGLFLQGIIWGNYKVHPIHLSCQRSLLPGIANVQESHCFIYLSGFIVCVKQEDKAKPCYSNLVGSRNLIIQFSLGFISSWEM